MRLCKLVHEVKILTNQGISINSFISCMVSLITRMKQSMLRSVVLFFLIILYIIVIICKDTKIILCKG